MRNLLVDVFSAVLGAGWLWAPSLLAQSPLALPFNSNNGLLGNACTFFDLTVTAPGGVTLVALDVNSGSAAGATGVVEVYRTANTYVGVQQTPAAWTLAASGEAVAAGQNNATGVCLGAGVFLPAGSHGVCIRHVGLGLRYTNSTGPVTVATAQMSFTGGQSAPAATPFAGAPISNRIWNGRLFYNVGSVAGGACAGKTVFGSGCYAGADSWYEVFAGGLSGAGSFDLAGAAGTERVLAAAANGASGYSVANAASAWFAPVAPRVQTNEATPAPMGDDSISGPLTLPFSFAFPGGSTTVIHAASNGFLVLGPTTATTGDFSPSAAELLSLEPRLLPLWGDFDPAVNLPTNPTAGIYFDVDPSNQAAYVTWSGVADRRDGVPTPGSTSIHVQCVLRANGTTEFRYGVILPRAGALAPVVVGASKGSLGGVAPASADPGNRDLTASVPFATNGPDRRGLRLDSNRPRLGTTWSLTTTDVDPVSPVAITFFGTAPVNPGLDLGLLGAAGCRAHVDVLLLGLSAPAVSGVAVLSVALPSTASLAGAQVVGQSVCFTPQNALGLLTSNGLTAVLGQ